jgi:hypothetical protein
MVLKSCIMIDDLYCINNTFKFNGGLDEHNIQHECGKECITTFLLGTFDERDHSKD